MAPLSVPRWTPMLMVAVSHVSCWAGLRLQLRHKRPKTSCQSHSGGPHTYNAGPGSATEPPSVRAGLWTISGGCGGRLASVPEVRWVGRHHGLAAQCQKVHCLARGSPCRQAPRLSLLLSSLSCPLIAPGAPIRLHWMRPTTVQVVPRTPSRPALADFIPWQLHQPHPPPPPLFPSVIPIHASVHRPLRIVKQPSHLGMRLNSSSSSFAQQLILGAPLLPTSSQLLVQPKPGRAAFPESNSRHCHRPAERW